MFGLNKTGINIKWIFLFECPLHKYFLFVSFLAVYILCFFFVLFFFFSVPMFNLLSFVLHLIIIYYSIFWYLHVSWWTKWTNQTTSYLFPFSKTFLRCKTLCIIFACSLIKISSMSILGRAQIKIYEYCLYIHTYDHISIVNIIVITLLL